jgi:hypothetical protein
MLLAVQQNRAAVVRAAVVFMFHLVLALNRWQWRSTAVTHRCTRASTMAQLPLTKVTLRYRCTLAKKLPKVLFRTGGSNPYVLDIIPSLLI